MYPTCFYAFRRFDVLSTFKSIYTRHDAHSTPQYTLLYNIIYYVCIKSYFHIFITQKKKKNITFYIIFPVGRVRTDSISYFPRS